MIQKLEHSKIKISQKIHQIFQVSYSVEAELLKANDFPPLKRSVANFLKSRTDFYGCLVKNQLFAVVEVKREATNAHIQSLVVDPPKFRLGIAKKMLVFVFRTYNSKSFSVETGIDNLPAIALYKKFGFEETKQWNTDHGVRKARFEKKI